MSEQSAPCCPGAGTMTHTRGCTNHPESIRREAEATTGHAWVSGRCAHCGARSARWAETCPGLSAALSLALRQAARAHLGLREGDYWSSDLAAAQATFLLDAGWLITPPDSEQAR